VDANSPRTRAVRSWATRSGSPAVRESDGTVIKAVIKSSAFEDWTRLDRSFDRWCEFSAEAMRDREQCADAHYRSAATRRAFRALVGGTYIARCERLKLVVALEHWASVTMCKSFFAWRGAAVPIVPAAFSPVAVRALFNWIAQSLPPSDAPVAVHDGVRAYLTVRLPLPPPHKLPLLYAGSALLDAFVMRRVFESWRTLRLRRVAVVEAAALPPVVVAVLPAAPAHLPAAVAITAVDAPSLAPVQSVRAPAAVAAAVAVEPARARLVAPPLVVHPEPVAAVALPAPPAISVPPAEVLQQPARADLDNARLQRERDELAAAAEAARLQRERDELAAAAEAARLQRERDELAAAAEAGRLQRERDELAAAAEAALDVHLAHMEQHRLLAALRAWQSRAMEARRLEQAEQAVARLLQRGTQLRATRAWRLGSAENRRLRGVAERVAEATKARRVRSACRHWLEWTSGQRAANELAAAHSARLLRLRLLAAMRSWRGAAAAASVAARERQAEAHMQQRLLRACLRTWQMATAAKRQSGAAEREVRHAVMQHRLRAACTRWLQQAGLSRAGRARAAEHAAHMERHILASALRMWARRSRVWRRVRQQLAALLGNRQGEATRAAFGALKEHASRTRSMRAVLKGAALRFAAIQAAAALASWRAAVARAARRRDAAERFHAAQRETLRATFVRWHASARMQIAWRAAAAALAAGLARSALAQWRAVAARLRQEENEELARRATKARALRILRDAFTAWARLAAERRALNAIAATAAALFLGRRLSAALAAWRAACAAKVERQGQAMRILLARAERALKTWQQRVHESRKRQEFEALVMSVWALHAQSNALRSCWEAWGAHVEWQRRIHHADGVMKGRQLSRAVLSWREGARLAKLRRACEERWELAMLHHGAVLKARIFKALAREWEASDLRGVAADKQCERRRLLAAAACLRAWRDSAVHAARVHAAVADLTERRSQRALVLRLRSWRDEAAVRGRLHRATAALAASRKDSALRGALVVWGARGAEGMRLRACAASARAAVQSLRAARAVQVWHERSAECCRLRRAARACVLARRTKALLTCLSAWQTDAARSRARGRADATFRRTGCSRALAAWRGVVRSARIDALQRACVRRRVAAAILQWRRVVRLFLLLRHHAALQQHEAVTGALAAWRAWAGERRSTRFAVNSARADHADRCARAVLAAWRETAHALRMHRAEVQREQAHRSAVERAWEATRLRSMRVLFSTWADAVRRTKASRRIAGAFTLASSVRPMFEAWRRAAVERAAVRRDVTALLQACKLRALARAWAGLVENAHEARAKRFHAFRLLERAFVAWKVRVGTARVLQDVAVGTALASHELAMRRRVFARWAAYTGERARLHALTSQLSRKRTLRRAAASLRAWRALASRRATVVHVERRAARLFDRQLVERVFTSWASLTYSPRHATGDGRLPPARQPLSTLHAHGDRNGRGGEGGGFRSGGSGVSLVPPPNTLRRSSTSSTGGGGTFGALTWALARSSR